MTRMVLRVGGRRGGKSSKKTTGNESVELRQILTDVQHGFRAKRSTVAQLINNYWTRFSKNIVTCQRRADQ